MTPNLPIPADILDLLPDAVDGLPLRHAVEVRHPAFQSEAWLRLARARGVATVFTDSSEYPSFADITGGFVYARLMASREASATGYPGLQLDAWAKRALQWAQGEAPADLPDCSDLAGQMAELGSRFAHTSDGLPPELENQFLQQVYGCDHIRRSTCVSTSFYPWVLN